jgi:hypothetical protein
MNIQYAKDEAKKAKEQNDMKTYQYWICIKRVLNRQFNRAAR